MPKIKTRNAAKKRLKATGKKGKMVVTRQKAAKNHLLLQKSADQKSISGRLKVKGYGKALKRMLGKAVKKGKKS